MQNFVKFEENLSVCVKNIDIDIRQESFISFIKEFGNYSRLLYKNSKFGKSNYSIIQYLNEESADYAAGQINGLSLGRTMLRANKLQQKVDLFEYKQEYYDGIKAKVSQVLYFAKERLKNLYSVEAKQEEYLIVSSQPIKRDLHAHDLSEYLAKKVSERSPDILNKFRRASKKLTLDKLYILYNDEQAFSKFLDYLKVE